MALVHRLGATVMITAFVGLQLAFSAPPGTLECEPALHSQPVN